MKKVLITGKNSYLGGFVKRELEKDPQAYQVTELDMTDPKWTDFSFAGYDVVYHVAGLAHSTPDESQRDFYYQINTKLAYQTAFKASQEGVKQFIFMSSIIVYGSGEIGRKRTITKNTPLTPDNFYGDSKKQAEIKIRSIDSDMKVVILRPPMIYGPNSKGNYPLLAKFARKTPVFPTLKNERSMLFVGNLVQFIQKVIDQELEGVFLPQNEKTAQTKDLIALIAKEHGHTVHFVSLLNPLLKAMKKQTVVNKVFGNLIIDPSLSFFDLGYTKYYLEESIHITESGGTL
ncbi:NAD-dependent epimerase/dehydratase family protein [uncultured Faecalicoccus sp.]|uniref:NAD-dependent epimerase/dehydratase family protein n=1 Tax=uncultured Faecalicoccus sp. TaxID=1971760 RepID=UPI0025CCA34C|nr:NAD-dependent epimerase/dehydratase family protein [uncultured Faecalicoccus sp.]